MDKMTCFGLCEYIFTAFDVTRIALLGRVFGRLWRSARRFEFWESCWSVVRLKAIVTRIVLWVSRQLVG